MAVAAAIGLIAYFAAAGTGGAAHRTNPAVDDPAAATAIGGPLKAPHGLAVARNGDLYIVDTGRDQVLRRLPPGILQVVAGNGHRGFSGDGGPARDAELSLANDSGIAVARNGTLDIADSGNGRVRAVLANGIIETVAGDGKRGGPGQGLILHKTPALDTSLGEAAGLAIGPNGDLYIAAANVAPSPGPHYRVGRWWRRADPLRQCLLAIRRARPISISPANWPSTGLVTYSFQAPPTASWRSPRTVTSNISAKRAETGLPKHWPKPESAPSSKPDAMVSRRLPANGQDHTAEGRAGVNPRTRPAETPRP